MTSGTESPTPDQLISRDRKVQKKAIEAIYDYCAPRLRSMMISKQEQPLEVHDILQDAVAVVYQNVKSGVFEGRSSLTTYTLSICKNMWLYKLREEKKRAKVDLAQSAEIPVETNEPAILKLKLLKSVFGTLSLSCQEILKDFYYQKLSMTEIASKYKLENPQIAKNKKWRCMKRLMEIVKGQKLRKEDFFDE